MKLKRLKTSSLVPIAVLFVLTAYLFAFNRIRRRERVPAMTVAAPLANSKRFSSPTEGFCFLPGTHQLAVNTALASSSVDLDTGQMKPERFVGSGEISCTVDGKRIFITEHNSVAWRRKEEDSLHWIKVPKDGSYRLPPVVSPDGRYALAYQAERDSWNQSVHLIDVGNGRSNWREGFQGDGADQYPIVCALKFSPSGKYFAVATQVETDLSTHIGKNPGPNLEPKSINVELRRVPDGKLLCKVRVDNGVENVLGPKFYDLYEGHNSLPVAFSPDERLLAVGGFFELRLFNTRNGSRVGELPQAPPNHHQLLGGNPPLCFSADGRLLAVSYGKAIEVWSVPRRERLQLFYPASFALSFSPDGKWLASILKSGEVGLWEVGSLN